MTRNKGNKNCCCDGCHGKPRTNSVPTDEVNLLEQFCCKCIPQAVCVIAAGDYGSSVSRRVFKSCLGEQDAYNGDIVFYTGTMPINGIDTTINFSLKVRNELCYLCLDSDQLSIAGIVPDDCFLIDHSDTSSDPYCDYGQDFQSINFCQQFSASWVIDTSSYGTGDNATTTISIEKADYLSLKGELGCGGDCQCICRCVCFSVYKREPFSVDPAFNFVGDTESVCADIVHDTQENCTTGNLKLPGYAKWERTDGWGVSLSGDGQPALSSTTIIDGDGTIASSSCSDIEQRTNIIDDGFVFQIDAVGNRINVEQEYSVQSGESARRMIIYCYVQGENESVDIELWNPVTLAWDAFQTINGQAGTDFFLYDFSIDSQYTTGGVFLFRYKSIMATSIVIDYLKITSPDCCKLKLSLAAGVTFDSGDIDPVSIIWPNNCPEPFANWEFTDTDGNEWRVSWDCLQCGECKGVIVDGCCPNPIPRTVVATIDTACSECDTFDVVLTYDSVSWTYSELSHPCFGFVSIDWSPCGPLTISLGACGPENIATSTSMECEPLQAVYDGTVDGIGCCDGVGFGTDVTVTITE